MIGGGLPHTACAVCGHVLNQYTGSFGATWVHALEEDKDHPAVPVPSETIRTISLCDFCLAPDASWVLPVEDYRMPGGRTWGTGSAAPAVPLSWSAVTGTGSPTGP